MNLNLSEYLNCKNNFEYFYCNYVKIIISKTKLIPTQKQIEFKDKK
jgi:hypothetical protein